MAKRRISIGKMRALQRASTREGVLAILAIDHQDALRRRLNPDAPLSVSDEAIIKFKLDVVETMAAEGSGVLLDPIYGLTQAIQSQVVSHVGLLAPLEKSDYSMEPLPRAVELLPGWSVEQIKRMGADGVKLFFYYNADDADLASQHDDIIRRVAAQCHDSDIPLYAEPILYDLDPPLSASDDHTRLVVAAARRIGSLGADVLKMEFPLDVSLHADKKQWALACENLTQAVECPWVLLSAGVDFDTFKEQVAVACKSGASGFIGGRAIWGDACQIEDQQRRYEWLNTIGRRRMCELVEIATEYATPWTEYVETDAFSTRWYQSY